MESENALRNTLRMYEQRAEAIRTEKALLSGREHANNNALKLVKRRLHNYPRDLYWSTTWKGRLTTELINLILWYYVRLHKDPLKPIRLLKADLQPYLDTAASSVASVLSFCNFIESHSMGKLLKESARYNSVWVERISVRAYHGNPWKTVPLSGRTLQEVLQKVPTLTFKTRTVTATLFGPDGLLVFKCTRAAEVLHLCSRRLLGTENGRELKVFLQPQEAVLLPDGFCIPYRTLIPIDTILGTSQYSFILNTKSWRLLLCREQDP